MVPPREGQDSPRWGYFEETINVFCHILLPIDVILSYFPAIVLKLSADGDRRRLQFTFSGVGLIAGRG